MAKKLPVAKLMWFNMDFKCDGQGTSEGIDLLEPPAAGGKDSLEVAADLGRMLAFERAKQLPKDCILHQAKVGYYGKPPESLDCISVELTGFKTGSTYKFGIIDNKNSCVSMRLHADGGSGSTYWLRFIDDADAINNLYQNPLNPYLQTPGVAPVAATIADTKADIVRRWVEFILYYGVQGVRNPALDADPPLVPAPDPYLYSTFKRATHGKLTHRKLGKVAGAESGRKRAYT